MPVVASILYQFISERERKLSELEQYRRTQLKNMFLARWKLVFVDFLILLLDKGHHHLFKYISHVAVCLSLGVVYTCSYGTGVNKETFKSSIPACIIYTNTTRNDWINKLFRCWHSANTHNSKTCHFSKLLRHNPTRPTCIIIQNL